MQDLIKNLKEKFLGRICTLLTHQSSFPFKDAMQHSHFFTGKVEYIDSDGIWLEHLQSKTYSFYAFPIIGIVEEQVIAHDDPRAEKIKEELKKKEPTPSNFVSIDSLTNMVNNSKRH